MHYPVVEKEVEMPQVCRSHSKNEALSHLSEMRWLKLKGTAYKLNVEDMIYYSRRIGSIYDNRDVQ